MEEEREESEPPLDLEHEMRLMAMREEFDVFLDAVLTECCEERISLHLE